MKTLNKENFPEYKVARPEKIIQFGEGNFLRAFTGWIVDTLNKKTDFNGSMIIIQPLASGLINEINEQDGLYSLILQGLKDGQKYRKVTVNNTISRGVNPYTDFKSYLKLAGEESVRIIISNTTEAGITLNDDEEYNENQAPRSFPAKVTRLLLERFKRKLDGFIFLPCELIKHNGMKLKEAIIEQSCRWELEDEFTNWVETENSFYNTLVDRIVTGYPRDRARELCEEFGYNDNLIVEGEVFHLWVIEGDKKILKELPVDKVDLNIPVVDTLETYRTRKVRVLNGAHTAMVPVAYLAGIETVREAVEDRAVFNYVKKAVYEEVLQTIDMPKKELKQFADDVIERFKNPFIKHKLIDISLNSISKYKTRILPTVIDYFSRFDKLPDSLIFGLSALIVFYRGKDSNNNDINLRDDQAVLDFFKSIWSSNIGTLDIAERVLKNRSFWGEDLTGLGNMQELVSKNMKMILSQGMKKTIKER